MLVHGPSSQIRPYGCTVQPPVTPARSVACDDATLYSVLSRTPEHEAPCARPASAVGRRHRHQNQVPAFGTGHVLSASSDPVDDVGVTRRLGAGARRHAQQLGHASPKRPIARRAAATARPSSKVESSEFSDVGSGSRGTRRTPGSAAIAPWCRARNCLGVSAQTVFATSENLKSRESPSLGALLKPYVGNTIELFGTHSRPLDSVNTVFRRRAQRAAPIFTAA